MKQVLFISAFAMLLFSCTKKEGTQSETNPPVNRHSDTISDYSKLTVGNYWVYEIFNVDTLGNGSLIGTDSCYVKKDTVVNGNTYAVVVNLPIGESNPMLLRDSSTCLVDQHGIIYFAIGNNFNTVLEKDSGVGAVTIYSVPNSLISITVPLGIYNCYDYMGVATFTGNFKGLVRYLHNYYAPNVGLVECVFPYWDSWLSYEGKLLRAHVM